MTDLEKFGSGNIESRRLMGAYRKEVRVAATIVDESDGSTSEMEFISDSRTDIITIWIDGMEYSIVRTEFNSFVMHLNQMV